MPSPSPTKDFPRLAPPTPTTPSIHTSQSASRLHSPASPSTSTRSTGRVIPVTATGSPQRTLRKLASAHNLGSGSAASLRASIANPPSLIAQQRLHHQPPRRTASISPTRRYASIPSSANSYSNRNSTSSLLLRRSSPTRGTSRPNSDAPIVRQLNAAAAAMSSTALRNSAALNSRTAYDHIPLEKLIRDGPPDGNWDNAVECARLKVLQQEIKSDSDGMSNLRIYVWLIMLDAPMLSTDDYLSLVHRAASPAYAKIRNDTFRTLTTDPLFRRRVSEASLIRLLNAIAWKLHDSRPTQQVVILNTRQSLPAISHHSHHSEHPPPARNSTTPTPRLDSSHQQQQQRPGTSPAAKNRARALTLTTEGSETSVASEAGIYVQGMNVLAAPFLYAARSEAEAFTAFHRLLTREVPGYIRGAMDGVHRGLALVDKVLGIVDPKLSMYLTSKGLSAELYAFPSVLTLCACTPPLPEVLRLWDFLFAYGPHLNIVCIAAQLVTHRDELMASPNPSHFLRTFPALNAEKVQAMTLALLAKLPDDVYAEIVSHAM